MNQENDPDTLVTLKKTLAMLDVLKQRLRYANSRLPTTQRHNADLAAWYCSGAQSDVTNVLNLIEQLPNGKAKREILKPLGF